MWAIIELVINVSLSETLTLHAQTDAKGDFVMSLKRLPPLPNNISAFPAILSVTAGLSNTPDTAPDLTGYVALDIESSANAGQFATSYPMTLVPGERTRVNSLSKNYLAVQSV